MAAQPGTACLLGAFDIRSGEVLGQVVAERTSEATVAFMDRLADEHATGDVYIVWDNLNQRHGGRFHFVYTPKHASWMNQIEVWFSILQRRLLRYASFDSVGCLEREVMAFIRHWNLAEAAPNTPTATQLSWGSRVRSGGADVW